MAWPYANGPFHIGHLAGAYLPADIFARFHRLRGNAVLMVSGSDMHGTPVLVTAEREGSTAETVARRYDGINRAALGRLGISYDLFTSTHTPVHERTVQELFLRLLRDGYIDRRTEAHPYCPKHARFLPDRYLKGTCPNCGFEEARGDECDRCGHVLSAAELHHPVCALCGTPAEFRPSEHFYLRLDTLSDRLAIYLADKGYWRPNVRTFTQNFRAAGLRPTAVTRDLEWGVPIPLDGYPSKRFYVWFEAVIGYLSASREWAIRNGDPEAWHRFWDPSADLQSYYFVGKDNIYHHTVFWPAMLLALGDLAPPYDVPANEWLLLGGAKVSKSRDPDGSLFVPSLLERYPPDLLRFYAAYLAPQHHDTEFGWEEFHQVTDQVLANQWGNLVQRLLVFARDRLGGRIPDPPPGGDPAAGPLAARLRAVHGRIGSELERVHLKEALDLIFTEIREGNRRFHEARPWAGTPEEARRAVYEGLWLVRCAAFWLLPYLPESSARIFRMLGEPEPPGPGTWDAAPDPPRSGTPLGSIEPLFPRTGGPRPAAPGGSAATAATAPDPAAPPAPAGAPPSGTGPDAPLEIRAGRVLRVEPHPSADRLYLLEVDLGEERPRSIVAGLRPFLPAAAIQGAEVLILANLAPRTIRSFVSHGMLLAADRDGSVALLHPPPGTPPGAAIEGIAAPARTISIADLERTPLVIGRVLATHADGTSTVDLGERRVTVAGLWTAGENVLVRSGGTRTAADAARVLSFGPGRAARADAAVTPGARVR